MSKAVQDAPPSAQASKIDLRILLLALCTFAMGTDGLIIVGVLPVIARDLRVTEGVTGQLVTIFSLAYGLGAPILAILTGRWPRNQVLIVALGAFCLANVGSALSPTFGVLWFTRLLAGCFAALTNPFAFAIAVSLAPSEKRGQALSLVLGGATVAGIVGGPLGTWIGVHWGWRVAIGVVALMAGIACLILLLSNLPKAEAAPVLSLKERLAPLRDPRLLLALAPAFLLLIGFYVIYTYIAPMLQQNMHISDISGLLIAMGVGSVIGNVFGGRVPDRFGAIRPMMIILLALMLLAVAFSSITTTLMGGILALLLLGGLGPSFFVAQQHRLLGLAPEHANVILALNNSVIYLGVACGAALGGAALRFVMVTQLGWVGAVCMLLALLLFLSIRVSKLA